MSTSYFSEGRRGGQSLHASNTAARTTHRRSYSESSSPSWMVSNTATTTTDVEYACSHVEQAFFLTAVSAYEYTFT